MKSFIVASVVALGAGAVLAGQVAKSAAPAMQVYKSPTCGCCSKWVDHVRQGGFDVKVTELDDSALDALKTKHGVPRTAQSCHTGLVNGYVIEGHVPVAEVQRLLKERPAVAGIAVGGMPLGSPGMEVSGQKPQTYNVVTFDKAGATKVYSTQNK
jgi:hypothetical protein